VIELRNSRNGLRDPYPTTSISDDVWSRLSASFKSDWGKGRFWADVVSRLGPVV
jgi:hypothetical protein